VIRWTRSGPPDFHSREPIRQNLRLIESVVIYLSSLGVMGLSNELTSPSIGPRLTARVELIQLSLSYGVS
jgi:hypothetical protein